MEGRYCTIGIGRLAPGVVLVRFSGRDAGAPGDLPFREMERDLASHGEIALFIGATEARSASVQVSSEWALWMRRHAHALREMPVRTGTSYVAMSAAPVRKDSGLASRMRTYTSQAGFAAAFETAVARRG